MAAPSNPFAATGQWLRCALPAHAPRSDGEPSPEAPWTNAPWN